MTTPVRPVRLPGESLRARHGACVLDPQAAVRLPGRAAPRTTAYVPGRLVVAAGQHAGSARTLLAEAARGLGLRVTLDDRSTGLAACAGDDGAPVAAGLAEEATGPIAPADAWAVLQQARRLAGEDAALARSIGLDHLLVGAGADIDGLPQTSGHGTEGLPQTSGHGGYGRPGEGGRQPVTWLGQPPARVSQDRLTGRRPVVAVLDTGCADHPWLDGVVTHELAVGDVRAGLDDPATDPERNGDLVDPLTGRLDSHAGHGTFIAGLLRQLAPDADLVAVRVMASDGAVRESDLLHALGVLRTAVQRCRDGVDGGRPVDVVVLSLGYHHEESGDELTDGPLLEAVTALGQLGVAVVAAAGNSATTEPLYPAAFAPNPDGPVRDDAPDRVPVTSVAALNPDRTVSLFSNDGDWVRCWVPGAALVSTMPTFRGGGRPAVAFTTIDGTPRSSLDPDDFTTGFGVWSGTSFAAPVFAAHVASELWTRAGGAGLPAGVPDVAAARAALAAVQARFPRPARVDAGGQR